MAPAAPISTGTGTIRARHLALFCAGNWKVSAQKEQREPRYVARTGTLRMENSKMKQVMALVLSIALVGASAATTFAEGTGGGGGGGTGTKSTTTTTSPTTSTTTRQTTGQTTSPSTAPTTSKNMDCPGKAGKHGRHKGLANNPNC